MFNLIKNIFLIWLFIHIGAYLGDTKVAIGEKYIMGKVKTCCVWVSDMWNDEKEKEDKDEDEDTDV